MPDLSGSSQGFVSEFSCTELKIYPHWKGKESEKLHKNGWRENLNSLIVRARMRLKRLRPGDSEGRSCYQSIHHSDLAGALNSLPKPRASFSSPRSCGYWSRKCSQFGRCPHQWNSYTSPQTSSYSTGHQENHVLFCFGFVGLFVCFLNNQHYSPQEQK